LKCQAQGFSEIRTLRYPPPDQPNQDDPATMNDTINRERESNVKQIINMVSDPGYDVYKEFATHTRQKGSSGSLEDIHGTYHGLIGGPMDQGVLGHMATVPVAAFDPIFWFHHW
jgi:tyrosinase